MNTKFGYSLYKVIWKIFLRFGKKVYGPVYTEYHIGPWVKVGKIKHDRSET